MTVHGGRAIAATPGARGFDANAVVSARDARAFAAAGYAFAVRYIGRLERHANDLTVSELEELLGRGLAVMPVQHVESESLWTPTDDKGRRYGEHAADAACALALPAGTTVWLDLEGVAAGAPAEQVIRYCNIWHDHVAAAGYQPGVYVGWHAGLSAEQLYRRLKFTRYWGAYNLNVDQFPATCGVCMKQHVAGIADRPRGIPYPIDVNTIDGDALGRFPTWCAPAMSVLAAAELPRE